MTDLATTITPKSDRTIPLTQGFVAVVDAADYDFLMQWTWHAFKSPSGNVYAARNSKTVNGRRTHIFMHRVIANTPADMLTDHRNGNGLDNRRENLRSVTKAENNKNRKPNTNGRSRHKGVYWHKQRGMWAASIQIDGKRHHLGLFSNEALAAHAYAERAAKEFGEFNRI